VELIVADKDGEKDVLHATPEHPFWVQGTGWILAGNLNVNDKLQSADKRELTVQSVVSLGGKQTVYNFTVDGFHSYFVGNLGEWVHNTPDCGKGKGSKNVEYLDRVMGADEAKATKAANGLAPPPPGHRRPKHLMAPLYKMRDAVKAAGRLGSKESYSHHVRFKLKAGAIQWLKDNGFLFEDGIDNTRFRIPFDKNNKMIDFFNKEFVIDYKVRKLSSDPKAMNKTLKF
jgi:hypothetical protein